MAPSSEARAYAPQEVLAFERIFDAPPALVWTLWKDPEHLVRWHGPEGYWLTECSIDFRVGGKWARCMSRAADHAHRIWGEYLEIDEPRRLVFTYINDSDEHETIVSLDFEDVGGRTRMRFHQAPFLTVEERDGHGWGWMSSLDLLADYLVKVVANDGGPVGRPRRDGVADDIAAARERQDKVQREGEDKRR